MMNPKLVALAVKYFGIDEDAVTDEHIDTLKAMQADLTPAAPVVEVEVEDAEEKDLYEDDKADAFAAIEAKLDAQAATIKDLERKAGDKPRIAAITSKVAPQFAITKDLITHRADEAPVPADMKHRVADLQKFNDENIYLCSILSARDGRTVNPRETAHWKRFVETRGDFGKFVDEYQGFSVDPEFAKATFTTTTGADYLPTILSGELLRRQEYEMGVANSVRQVDLPSKTFEIPGAGSAVSVYKTTEAATPTQSDTDDRKVTFTASDVKGRSMYTDDLAEDSIIAILPRIQEEHAIALAKGIEFAVIHGDTDDTQAQASNTAQDGYLAWNFWNGIYAHAIASSTVTSASAARYTGDMALASIADLGKYLNSDMVWTAHPIQVSYMRAMKDNATDKNLIFVPGGANASWTDRPLVELLGYPVIPSGGNSITNGTTGYYTGTTVDRTQVIAFNRMAFALGDRRAVTVETDKTIATGVIEVVTTWRGDFQCLYAATDTCSAATYNIDYDA